MPPEINTPGWTIAEGHTGAYPFQLRFRQFDAQFTRNAFPIRMNIFWSMSEPDMRGYPTPSELIRMHSFENDLVGAEESENFSVLSMVLTGHGEREFVFYTRDPQEFVKRLSMMPQESNRYPIKIHRNNDLAWEYFDAEVESVRTS